MSNATRPLDAKWCPRCQAHRPVQSFARDAKRSDGLRAYCRPCQQERQREWRSRNPDRVVEYRRTFRERHLEDERARERDAARREWAERREEILARRRAWEAKNRDERRRHKRLVQSRRRARQLDAPSVSFTLEQLEQRVAYFGHRCWLCGAPSDAIDHVKPLARGGSHMLSNLRPICTSCNSSKGSQWPFRID